MEIRDAGLASNSSEQDPAYLHPGRVGLILLQDLEEGNPDVLVAGVCAESRAPALRIPAEVAEGMFDIAALALWRRLPEVDWRPEGVARDPELLEELVTAEPNVQRIALAEALDQIRHAHLWTRSEDRARAAQFARGVLAPAASRVHPVLERRFDWWVRRVGDSFSFGRK